MAGARIGRWLAGLAALMLTACGSPGTGSAGPAAFATCAACHSTAPGGKRGLGPNLYGVVGRSAGQAPGFSYSPALRDSGIIWSAATLDRYLADPTALVPGTRMRVKTRAAEDRRAIIKYLNGRNAAPVIAQKCQIGRWHRAVAGCEGDRGTAGRNQRLKLWSARAIKNPNIINIC